MADGPASVAPVQGGSAAARPVVPAAASQPDPRGGATASQPAPHPAPTGSNAGAAPLPAQGGTPVTVTRSTVPLASLPAPTTLAARVVAAETGGQLQLETALGRVTVDAGKLALDLGTAVRLRVEVGGAVRLQLAPQQGNAAGANPGSGAVTGAARTAAGPLQPGDVVQARLVPNPVPGQPAGPPPAQSTITVRIVSVEQPPASGTQAPTSGPPAPAASGTGQAAATPLQATVSGRAALGQPVLDTAAGRLVLNSGDLPDRALVRLEVLASVQASTRPAPVIAPLADAIDELLAVLTAAQPAVAAALEAGRVPRMGGNLTSATLFLISALQGGGVRSLIGQEAQAALQKTGRPDVLKRLAEALAQRGVRLESDGPATAGEPWRTLYLPVATIQGWQPLRVAWREPEGGDGAEDGDDRARFQIDFSFSKLGPIRLDGLAGTGRLDLLLVSRNALTAASRAEIEALFTDTIEAIGLRGHIRFVEQADLAAPEVRADQPHASLTA